jgi:hypothetical protein
MTTKKIVLIVGSIVLAIGLIIVIFVGGIIGVALYSVGRSEAGETAKNFLRKNQRLKQDIGNVNDFGSFVTGNINIRNNDGSATINIKVIGEHKTVNASVDLIYHSGRPWRVIAASYQNDSGQMIDLLNPYESLKVSPRLAA